MGKVNGSIFYSPNDVLMDVHYGDVEATITILSPGEAQTEADNVTLNPLGELKVCVNLNGKSGDQFKHYVLFEDTQIFPYPYYRYVPYNECETFPLDIDS